MGAPVADLALLVFYGLVFVLHVVVAAAQLLMPPQGRSSAADLLLKLGLLVGLGVWFYLPVIKVLGRLFGYSLAERSRARQQMIWDRVYGPEDASRSAVPDHQADAQMFSATGKEQAHAWRGIIGFFHPFCNAGGGGERVLWAAIKATQDKYPDAVCVVYTGDHEATKTQIIERVKTSFNIELNSPKVFFLYLSTRRFVLASTWPHFTLLGQSLGSVLLAVDAFQLLVPDVFIDTMGYAFALACARLLFPKMATAAYVHYPTISTDMLGSLDAEDGKGLNAGAGRGWRGFMKKKYWQLFAWGYSRVGATIDTVVTNSSWTNSHITKLWGRARKSAGKTAKIDVLFPPCAVEDLEDTIPVDKESEAKREDKLVYIAQFRPEKNHKMILEAFSELMQSENDQQRPNKDTKLVLIGSVRDSLDATRVYELRLLAHELKIQDSVEFVTNASWPEILQRLRTCSVGVNGMWNEHFGIGVVEYQAAGLISVVHDSGGPKIDIVTDVDGKPTGFHASNSSEFAAAFRKALSLSTDEKLAMRLRARESAKRFTEERFATRWKEKAEEILRLQASPRSAPLLGVDGKMVSATYVFVLLYELYRLTR